MTNTLNTPIEALEIAYPLRVERYELRPGSGGAGRFRGGLGIRREIRILGHRARLSLLTDRRVTKPYGIFGGGPGARGANALIIKERERPLPGKTTLTVEPGALVVVRTPGGGGYGNPQERERRLILKDCREGRISAEHALKYYGFDPREGEIA